MAEITDAVKQEALRALIDKRKQRQKYDWLANARPSQLAPSWEWFLWVLVAGRGYGKTRTSAEWIRQRVEKKKARRIAIIAPYAHDAREICVEGESGILNVFPPEKRPTYTWTKRRIDFHTGAIATIYSADDPDRFRGPEHDTVWGDEFTYWPYPDRAYENLMMGLRISDDPRGILSCTPKPIKILQSLLDREGKDVAVTRGSTYDNKDNLADQFIQHVGSKEGTRMAAAEIYGDTSSLWDVEGAQWDREQILYVTPNELPPMQRIVIAVDPPNRTSNQNQRSDDCGICVCGLGVDNLGYVLEDATFRAKPKEWANKVAHLYHNYEADLIVAEGNQGGDMVETTIQTVDPNLPVKMVYATRGKILRSEPVAMLYDKEMVRHLGRIADLEDQMCSYDGTGKSPNNLDAFVYAMTELMVSSNSRFDWDIY